MTLSGDNTPYIITRDGSLKVFRFDGTNWTQVGNGVGDGYHFDITVAGDGTPYISFMDVMNDSKGICKKWDGSNWVTVGGAHFTESQVAVWTKLATNSNNQPVILYGTGTGAYGPFYSNVIEFDGTHWQVVGGGDIDNSNSTYFNHDIILDNDDNIYVSLTTEDETRPLNVYVWEGATWAILGENISGGGTYHNNIALDLQNNPVVGFRDESKDGKTTVMRLDNNNWTTIGLAGFSNTASFQSLAYSPGGEPYIAYQDESNGSKATVKRYGQDVLNTVDFPNNTIDLIVYPNPNSGEFTVLSSTKGSFQLIDLQGRIISEGKLKSTSSKNGKHAYSFNYSTLPQGVYLLHITNGQNREAVKIIIK
jgi:hypothetical protein